MASSGVEIPCLNNRHFWTNYCHQLTKPPASGRSRHSMSRGNSCKICRDASIAVSRMPDPGGTGNWCRLECNRPCTLTHERFAAESGPARFPPLQIGFEKAGLISAKKWTPRSRRPIFSSLRSRHPAYLSRFTVTYPRSLAEFRRFLTSNTVRPVFFAELRVFSRSEIS